MFILKHLQVEIKLCMFLHCKNCSVITSTPNLLYTHTYFHFGVSMEQIRCAGQGRNYWGVGGWAEMVMCTW